MKEIHIRAAERSDAPEILRLYGSVVGSEGCTWNEYYPSQLEIDSDLDAMTLFVAVYDGIIIGAASVVPENELDGLEFWSENDNCGEIARIAVAPDYRKNGYGAMLVGFVCDYLRRNEYKAVHLLVAKSNRAAVRTYEKLGFSFVGECSMYENEYFACELPLCCGEETIRD